MSSPPAPTQPQPPPPRRRKRELLGPTGLIVMVVAILAFTAVSIAMELAANRGKAFKADPTTEHFAYHNLHFSGNDRKAHDQGLCWFVPILYHEVPRYYRENCELDVAMMPVAPMDRNGYFNFSLSNSHARAICDKAKTIIVDGSPPYSAACARANSTAQAA